MSFPLKIKELCAPASIYFYISVFGVVASLLQNVIGFNNNKYKCGTYSVLVPSVMLIFLFKAIYIIFWTYMLNLLCKDDNKNLAWVLVIFPFLLFFVLLGTMLLTAGKSTSDDQNMVYPSKNAKEDVDVFGPMGMSDMAQ